MRTLFKSCNLSEQTHDHLADRNCLAVSCHILGPPSDPYSSAINSVISSIQTTAQTHLALTLLLHLCFVTFSILLRSRVLQSRVFSVHARALIMIRNIFTATRQVELLFSENAIRWGRSTSSVLHSLVAYRRSLLPSYSTPLRYASSPRTFRPHKGRSNFIFFENASENDGRDKI